jgi:hypothetical protein
MKKIWIGITIVLGIILVVGVSLSKKDSVDIVGFSGGVEFVSAMEHDWGDINIQGGDVEYTFVLKNTANEPLLVQTAETSCMCTSAYIDIPDERTSPKFSMHNNVKKWDGIVPAGEEFTVRTVFDPMAHGPEATGAIQRSVFLMTSADPDDVLTTGHPTEEFRSVVELNVEGEVYSEEEYQERQRSMEEEIDDAYSEAVGDFTFAELEYDFGTVKQSEGIVSYDFPFRYDGEEPITVTGVVGSCACTTGSVDVDVLESGDEGVLTVDFDPNLHEEPEGRFFKTVALVTQPETEESIEVKVWVEIDLDLGPETYKLQEEHSDE